MPSIRTPSARMPRYEIYCTKIYCVGQPPIAPPTPDQQASDPAQPAKQKLLNRPNLAEPFLNQQLASPEPPKTPSANLGFEIRGFSCPCRRLSPKETHSAKLAKPVYQTNPIPTASDKAIGRASGRPPPPSLPPSPNPAPAPKRQNRTTKQTQS